MTKLVESGSPLATPRVNGLLAKLAFFRMISSLDHPREATRRLDVLAARKARRPTEES